MVTEPCARCARVPAPVTPSQTSPRLRPTRSNFTSPASRDSPRAPPRTTWRSRRARVRCAWHPRPPASGPAVSSASAGPVGAAAELVRRGSAAPKPQPASADRSAGPFVAVAADAQDPDRFPPFFFGQARDWRGLREEAPGLVDHADGGTLFLENIDALSLPMQVKLKRLIQGGNTTARTRRSPERRTSG